MNLISFVNTDLFQIIRVGNITMTNSTFCITNNNNTKLIKAVYNIDSSVIHSPIESMFTFVYYFYVYNSLQTHTFTFILILAYPGKNYNSFIICMGPFGH